MPSKYAVSTEKSKRGDSSAIAVLEVVLRSVPPRANGALAKTDAMISIAARDFIEPVIQKQDGVVCSPCLLSLFAARGNSLFSPRRGYGEASQ